MRSACSIATLFFILAGPVQAQTVDKAMILHPGDTITWEPLDDHVVLFGDVGLTPFRDVAKLLQFDPAEVTCSATAADCFVSNPTTRFTATVRSDIDFSATGAVTSFDFTCGVHTDMIARLFTVEPVTNPAAEPRQLLITTVNGKFQWILREDVVLNKDHAGHS